MTATHCNTLQHTATHSSAQHHTATHCTTHQLALSSIPADQHRYPASVRSRLSPISHVTATHYTTLQHTAPHSTTQHHTAPHCNTLQLALYLPISTDTLHPFHLVSRHSKLAIQGMRILCVCVCVCVCVSLSLSLSLSVCIVHSGVGVRVRVVRVRVCGRVLRVARIWSARTRSVCAGKK